MVILPAAYFSAAFYFFFIWFAAFQKDPNLSAQEKRLSMKVLIVATILWPLVAPISYLSKQTQPQNLPEDEHEGEEAQAFLSAVAVPVVD